MATLTFPNITPDTLDFGIRYNTQISTTALSGVTQTIELPGARWAGSMTFRDLSPVDSAALKAFLLELRGAAGRFYFGDLTNPLPFNTIVGSEPLTIEGSSTVRFLDVSTSGTFSVGDYVQIENDEARELKMVVAVSGSSPQQLKVEPAVRRTDYKGASKLYYTNPTGSFLLDSDDQARWAVRSKARLSDISLSFVEG